MKSPFNPVLPLLGRGDAERDVAVRLRLAQKNKGGNEKPDGLASISECLEMIETLPGISRSTAAPPVGFLRIAHQLAGEGARGERVMAYGKCFEFVCCKELLI